MTKRHKHPQDGLGRGRTLLQYDRSQADTREGAAAPASAATRSPDGRLLVVAIEATTPVIVDGALDEEVWQRAEPVGSFVQSEPRDGQPATERSEVRLAYDHDHLYIAATLHESEPGLAMVNEIRKDFRGTDQDTFEVIIDPFADRRNGFVFITNREGARDQRELGCRVVCPHAAGRRRLDGGDGRAVPIASLRAGPPSRWRATCPARPRCRPGAI